MPELVADVKVLVGPLVDGVVFELDLCAELRDERELEHTQLVFYGMLLARYPVGGRAPRRSRRAAVDLEVHRDNVVGGDLRSQRVRGQRHGQAHKVRALLKGQKLKVRDAKVDGLAWLDRSKGQRKDLGVVLLVASGLVVVVVGYLPVLPSLITWDIRAETSSLDTMAVSKCLCPTLSSHDVAVQCWFMGISSLPSTTYADNWSQ